MYLMLLKHILYIVYALENYTFIMTFFVSCRFKLQGNRVKKICFIQLRQSFSGTRRVSVDRYKYNECDEMAQP